jgi:hypothetical protein
MQQGKPEGGRLTKMYSYLLTGLLLLLTACGSHPKDEIQLTPPVTFSASKINPGSVKHLLKDSTFKGLVEKATQADPKKNKKQIQTRLSEIAASDHKFNGEPVLIQLTIAPELLQKHPDTLKQEVRSAYKSSERFFPRSIADNFEAGISTEQISYPRVSFSLELFTDDYSEKPYQTMHYKAWRDNSGIIQVE